MRQLLSAENDFPASSVLHYMAINGCKTVVIENPYVDKGHLDSYSEFYSRMFREVNRFTTRMHFFSEAFDEYAIARELLVGRRVYRDKALGYLGFSVIRPLPAYKIGRTVIAPPPLNKETEFILGHSGFSVNLSGLALKASGFPFMQQDTEVSCCATAALYMATKSLSQRFNYVDSTPAQITALATRFSVETGRAMPSSGIKYGQILEALRAMNYAPNYYCPIHSPREAQALIYSYLESEFPLILLLYSLEQFEGHAIVTVGHDLKAREALGIEATLSGILGEYRIGTYPCYSRSEWVEHFFVHDDASGPYRRISFCSKGDIEDLCLKLIASRKEKRRYKTAFHKKFDEYPCPLIIEATSYDPKAKKFQTRHIPFLLMGITVPLPPEVTLSIQRVADVTAGLLNLIQASFLIEKSPVGNGQIAVLPQRGVVLRPFLVLSSDFKSSLRDKRKRLPWEVELVYKGLNLPRYIWLVEIYDLDAANDFNSDTVCLSGEIIIDPSARPYSKDYMAVHVLNKAEKKGFLWVNRNGTDFLTPPTEIKNDRGHSPLFRSFER
ncbi:hypothetical protein HZA56_07620 [Candidatus Poribacteria bacterium]|nr:hypothetical protein [Candidatus Poribacteria bacterium]